MSNPSLIIMGIPKVTFDFFFNPFLAILFSCFVRLLKWDLITETPNFVEGDKLSWKEQADEETMFFEIKNKRFIPGSGNLRFVMIFQEIVE